MFAVTLADLRHHYVNKIFEGEGSTMLKSSLDLLKGRKKVKAVCMDLSSPFRNLVQRLFPYATIVADRFHVIRRVIETFHEFCKAVDPEIKWKRGITCALRTKGENLRAAQKLIPDKEFGLHPVLQTAYQFKEELCPLLTIKERRRSNCLPLLKKLKEMVWQMLNNAPAIFRKLGHTIRQWFEALLQ